MRSPSRRRWQQRRSEPVSVVRGVSLWLGSLLLLGLLLGGTLVGCGAPAEPEEGAAVGQIGQAVCVPGDGGGDLGCGCTLNDQCTGFDDDTRTLVCDVPAMGAGKCTDCLALVSRPVGCACSVDSDCAMGLVCNGRTCQALRSRGEFCVRDTDCGSDMKGTMGCLPTKSWCGPLEDDYPCDFGSDCLSGNCSLGVCTSGGTGTSCAVDADCAAPLICNTVFGVCMDKQPDGKLCFRNAECQNQCNSFSGQCLLGKSGTICTTKNPDGDCDMGLTCTDCGMMTFTCRMPGSPCT